MTHLLGYIFAGGAIFASLFLLGQSLELYADLIALIMVFGGTFCVMLISSSPHEIISMVKIMFTPKRSVDSTAMIATFVNLAKLAQVAPGRVAVALDDPKTDSFLKEGIELIMADFSQQEIEMIMSERLYSKRVHEESSANVLKSLSKYPPAFGLMGTVLGLVSVMRGMSEGSTPEDTGLRMAIALVATLYGLVAANIVLLPTAEAILGKIKTRVAFDKLIIEGVLLLKERASPLLVQEILNSYVQGKERKDHVGIRSVGRGNAPAAERGVA